ncbi:MAG: tRNA 4-thiouridine(8) synthase ThiI [Bacilli bacterium]|nr:tRNA 4-thiouridine(8) synthase ThiI [Bacilli bacterium]
MKTERIMIRFGELSTKGKNKKDFIFQLGNNIRHALKDYKKLKYVIQMDHIYIDLNGEDEDAIITRLQDVSGIHSFSLVSKIDADIENIKNKALEVIKSSSGKTFKVKTKRAEKTYPIHSEEINRMVAGKILANTDWKVDVHNPDILLSIEIRQDGCYIFTKTIEGAGGYPLGVGGKVMMMISGGIDSPVAAYQLMKRGVMCEMIHYASPPYTSAAVLDKIKDLCKVLNKYQPQIRVHIIPFTTIQEQIYKNCDESYAITIMRRMMYRLAERYALRRKCLAIANGESVGQVASQTLASMKVINGVTNFPVIRPLATIDKIDIIKTAEKIGTYDISIRPYEDCCTIFDPKNPKTHPHLDEVEKYEQSFDYETLINEAIQNTEVIFVKEDEKTEDEENFL